MLQKVIVSVLIILQICGAVDITRYEEGAGIIPPLANVDRNWLFSVPSWNFVAGSKYGFFRFAKSFNVKSMDELSEDDLEEECLTTRLSDQGIVTLQAFGKEVEYVMTFGESPAVINWRIKDAPQEKDQTAGVSYIIATDNKTYFATLQYWDHSRKGWLVMSTENSISPEIKVKVHEQIKPYGFDLSLGFYKDFATCPLQKEKIEL